MVPEQVGLTHFWQRFSSIKRRILISDYDGTLAPFRAGRMETVLYAGTEELLRKINESGDRLVFVTGRSISELEAVFPFSNCVEVWGCHGFERRQSGCEIERFKLDGRVNGILQEAYHCGVREGLTEFIETKHGSVVLHVRGQDAGVGEQLMDRALSEWEPLCEGADCTVHSFDGGVEIRSSQRDKGNAVTDILNEENGEYIAAYLGDDETDEDAFREIDKHGLGILVRSQWRDTCAKAWLKPPHELNTMLLKWVEDNRNG